MALGPVEPGRVVGAGAVCDHRPQCPSEPRTCQFSVSEFVRLDDGRQVTLHEDRGFTIGVFGHGAVDFPGGLTLEGLASEVLTTVLPDDEGDVEDHPWWWLASLPGSVV